jgi:carbonic anhydrase/acetyltransferase-like protein (isoleucine patch superfamily)
MKAVVLNGAKIGRGCLIGANALVTEGREIPDHSMVLGSPGKVARVLDADQVAALRQTALGYQERMRLYRAGLSPV